MTDEVRAGRAELLAILLNACGAQARKTMTINRTLPGEKLLDGQAIAITGFIKAQQAAAHGGNDFRLATDTQRWVSGAGRSAIVSGLPSGPIT